MDRTMVEVKIVIGNIERINDSIKVVEKFANRTGISAYEGQILSDVASILEGIKRAERKMIA